MLYRQVRAQSEAICAPLELEDFVVQPCADVSPPKWHLGHTTWFFENFILADYLPDYQRFDERLNYIFNSYYESQGPRILRSNRGNISRPGVERILQYRHHVDAHMERFLEMPLTPDLQDVITIGLHHEQQHQELLLTDIKYILGTNPFFPTYAHTIPTLAVCNSFAAKWIPVEGGLYDIGHTGKGFCFDNELGAHQVYLQNFEIQNRLITNEEYLEFMQDGGYTQFEHWLSEGWEWVKQLEVKAPLYWYEQAGTWYQYTLHGLRAVRPEEPVTHISYFEADAYARWRGLRLPTEAEWEVACKQLHLQIPDDGNFLESAHFQPIAQQHETDSQLIGNAWEWTASAYLPYPDFPRLKGALGEYNGKFMVNQMVLRGGSCATPRSHIRATYRNFFQTDKRWQFTGLRLAR
ncbi:MAG TPA: ergothioneine biosynthesis protein EgtB [Saprospiraceae bacterium]|nr:ergothioneine biosynthesis protein EgtB [Saprospiraceae bacterium]HMP13074.1 ergothioneine biosynthesis protein EgtB [Saprospiraceae bacterium]